MTRREQALEVLADNRREGYSIPSAELYPFQWNWDSAFIALGLSQHDPAAAKRELLSLLDAAWPSGMVPHIVFHEDASGYFPGPREWDVAVDGTATSGITQPPVVATAARRIYERTGDASFRRAVREPLERHLSWWLRERSIDGDLVYVRHPWETGMDDSPAWNAPLEAVDPGDQEYERRDLKDEDSAEERPTDWDYDRYVALLRQARALDWDESVLRRRCPFIVEDVLTNSIFVRACDDLAALHAAAGDRVHASHWRDQADATRAAMRDRLWDDDLGLYVSYDRVGDRALREPSVAGLSPLFGDVPVGTQRDRLLQTLRERFFDYQHAIPSYVGPSMNESRYWRGPVWINCNWLVADGLRQLGVPGLADRIRDDALELIEEHGFREYFSPTSGAGHGSDRFSWTAALYLEWSANT